MIEKLLPAIITIIGNVIFYLLIKGRIEKSIERNKIAYSGIFTEKIKIYKELLEKTYSIKRELNRFQYVGTKEEGREIMQSINNYIQFYLVNQPFLSEKMISDLNEIRKEFQEVFDAFYKHIASDHSGDLKEFFEAGNKLKLDEPFKLIEERIIDEMRSDLKVIKFSK